MQTKAYTPSPDIAFAQACEVSGFSRLLFISGQVPEDENATCLRTIRANTG